MFLRSFDARIHIWHLFHVRESKPPTRIRQHMRASRDASTLTPVLNRQLFSFRSEAAQIRRKDDRSNGGITGGVVCMIDPSKIAYQNLRMDSCGVSRGHACMRLQKATTWSAPQDLQRCQSSVFFFQTFINLSRGSVQSYASALVLLLMLLRFIRIVKL